MSSASGQSDVTDDDSIGINMSPQPQLQQQQPDPVMVTTPQSLTSELQVLKDCDEVFIETVGTGKGGQKMYDILHGESGECIWKATYIHEGGKKMNTPWNYAEPHPQEDLAECLQKLYVTNPTTEATIMLGLYKISEGRRDWNHDTYFIVDCQQQVQPRYLATLESRPPFCFQNELYTLIVANSPAAFKYTIQQGDCSAFGHLWKCKLSSFQIKNEQDEVIGDMKIKKPDGKFAITFPPDLPVQNKGLIIAAGIILNRYYFEYEGFPSCSRVGTKGSLCLLLWYDGMNMNTITSEPNAVGNGTTGATAVAVAGVTYNYDYTSPLDVPFISTLSDCGQLLVEEAHGMKDQRVYSIINAGTGERILQASCGLKGIMLDDPNHAGKKIEKLTDSVYLTNAMGEILLVASRSGERRRFVFRDRVLIGEEEYVIAIPPSDGGFHQSNPIPLATVIPTGAIPLCSCQVQYNVKEGLDLADDYMISSPLVGYMEPVQGASRQPFQYTLVQIAKCCCCCGCTFVGDGCCWSRTCPCCVRAFQIRQEPTTIGMMNLVPQPQIGTTLSITFPPTIPPRNKAALLMSGLVMNRLYFEDEGPLFCCRVGRNGRLCILLLYFFLLYFILYGFIFWYVFDEFTDRKVKRNNTYNANDSYYTYTNITWN